MNKSIELLSPVGDFECLKAAVQNGANAVYLGASQFSARASAKNFNLNELKIAIDYAHLRNCMVHLTLNTLLKNDELQSAFELACKAYEFGVDAIIIQDLGLSSLLKKYCSDLPLHASTQMSIHNLVGVKKLEELGFSRVVLSRELSLNEITYISNNSNIEIETFIHGALCISYSGQCLFSSMVGGRSGNRGKCAQACRLPYTLLENNSIINSGYLLSPRDMCGLEYLSTLICNTNITSFKIEGRMKTPEYVATVTRIYRKYIDKVLNDEKYKIDKKDFEDLQQVFNRGGFSSGHLCNSANQQLIFKDKSNNMGIYIGNVNNYNATKGHVSLNLNSTLSIGDSISFEKEDSRYTISELMDKNNENIENVSCKQTVKIGRMKGNIHPGDKIYKLSSKPLSTIAKNSYDNKENIKNKLTAIIKLHLNKPVELLVKYNKHEFTSISTVMPIMANKLPITKERIIEQLSKTGNTPFSFHDIKVEMDDNIFINIHTINELRRNAIENVEKFILHSYERTNIVHSPICFDLQNNFKRKSKQISLLLYNISTEFDYSTLKNIDKIYIPISFFTLKKYNSVLTNITNCFNTYIYMPNIIQENYRNYFLNAISTSLENYSIKGFVVSNIGSIECLKDYLHDYEFIANFSFNVFNNYTVQKLQSFGLQCITLSPELNISDIQAILNTYHSNFELIVYGRTLLMTTAYCFLGNSNKCYPECKQYCKSTNNYYLKDRLRIFFSSFC